MSIAKSKVRSRRSNIALAEAIEPRRLLSTITVNSLSDAATQSAGTITLRDALADAASAVSPAAINFSPSLFANAETQTISLTQGELTVADNVGALTIAGPGAGLLAINANGKSRVLEIDTANSVTISGLTITHGSAVGGGGIEDVGGPLTLQSVIITKNTSTSASSQNAMGGGILSESSLTIQDSTISSNSAVGGQGVKYGGIPTGYSADGGGVASEGTLTISGSVLNDNVAQGGNEASADAISGGGSACGGAVWAATVMTVSDSTLTGNQALGGDACGMDEQSDWHSHGGFGSGGAIYSPASTTLLDVSISGNGATGGSGIPFAGHTSASYGGQASGGGVDGGGGDVIVTGSIISDNSTVGGSNIIQYTGADSGGLCGGVVDITNSTIDNNSAVAGQHHGLGANTASGGSEGAGLVCYFSLNLTRSSVSNNEATGTDGWALAPDGTDAEGAGIYDEGNMTLLQSTISGNIAQCGSGYSASSGDADPSLGAGNGGSGLSGGILCIGDNCTVTECTFSGNILQCGNGGTNSIGTGPGGNGGSGQAGASYINLGSSASYLDCTITGNMVVSGIGGSSGGSFGPGTNGQGYAGGLNASWAPLLDNCIVSGNTVNGAFDDISGIVDPNSAHNLVGVGGTLVDGANGNIVGINDPQLSPLGNYGGLTTTMVPFPGSPAIDNGSDSLIPAGLTVDQRGLPRISGASVDIGATEFTITAPSISGFVTSNGIGLSGITVYLDYNNNGKLDPGEPSTTTYPSGQYIFEGLSDGAYIVRQLVPAGNHQVTPTNNYGNHVTLSGLSAVTVVNFTDALITGSISGVVETGSRVLNGVMVYLDANNNGVFDSDELFAVTNSAGQYSFANLPPGQYVVRQVLPLGFSQTKPGNNFGNHVTLTGLESITNQNFIDVNGTGSVSGAVVGSGGEPLAGVTVFLDANNDGHADNHELDTVTNSVGQYTFNNVLPGEYIVRQILPAGDVQVTPVDNYGDHITVGPIAVITNQNFTDALMTGWISGTVTVGPTDLAGITVYLDANNNGKLDPGEMSTTTNSSGQYSFSGVPLGSYVIRQILPAGYVQVSPTNNFGMHLTLFGAQSVINEDFSDSLVDSAADDVLIDMGEIMPSDLVTVPA